MKETRDFEARLRELGTQIERLDYDFTQQDILLRSILKHKCGASSRLVAVGSSWRRSRR